MSISRPRHFNEIKSEGGGIQGPEGPQGIQGPEGPQGNPGQDGDNFWTQNGDNISYNTGDVGIGTASPGSALHIFGASGIQTIESTDDNASSRINFVTTAGHDWEVGGRGSTASGLPGCFYIHKSTGSNKFKFIINENGNVGIGTGTASPATNLHVKYSGTPRLTSSDTPTNVGGPNLDPGGRYYLIAVGGWNTAEGAANKGYNMDDETAWFSGEDNREQTIIYAQGGNIMAGKEGGDAYNSSAGAGTGGRVITWWGTLNASDERIKYDIEDINDSSALEKLREIKPRTYKYRDDRALQSGGRGTVYGFIAQEVKSVFPQGVSILGEEHVPNIQEVGVYSSANKTITFTNFDTSGIPTSGVIRVVTAKNECEYLDINYISIIDSHTIEVETDISEHCGAYDEENKEFIAGNNIYVEGCQVPDFHLLRKESIFTLATAALQEVDRQLQAEKVKTATLETTVADLVARIAALENA